MLGFWVDMNIGGTLFNSNSSDQTQSLSYSLAWGAVEPQPCLLTLHLHLTCEDKGLPSPLLAGEARSFLTPGLLLGQQLKLLIPLYWPLRRWLYSSPVSGP